MKKWSARGTDDASALGVGAGAIELSCDGLKASVVQQSYQEAPEEVNNVSSVVSGVSQAIPLTVAFQNERVSQPAPV